MGKQPIGIWMFAALSLSLLASPAFSAEPATLDVVALVSAHCRPFSYAGGKLAGPGSAMLAEATADSQFVLVGESHYLREIPAFTGALFAMLRDRHAFHHLIVEQDRYAIQDALARGRRGNAGAIGAHARRYPGLYEFASDQDLELLALVGRLEPGPQAICGVEQALGAPRVFDELHTAAPNAAVRNEIASLRALALKLDPEPKYSVNFLLDASVPVRLQQLRAAFHAKPGSRHDEMLLGLERSSEIFGYYRRAEAGEPVGLFNNTVREAWMKRLFGICYRQAAKSERLPKALFKFGDNHMFHGKNPTQAFPIGNLAHELAIFNGKDAYGIAMVPLLGENYKDVPEWMRVMLPAAQPAQPTIVDLRALRPYQRFLRVKLKETEYESFREVINGYDAIVILPNERNATTKLSGLKIPGQ